ncbi:hypothetical protein OESDEN_06323 [Oesophagostomum dentatum]|uniref:Uncharacterized protein n=1 Tax=Oesophagostomum dentatum TaxID=61180 RepID=A0A0B1T944_OESDE|nr:hypothetical protein OESDEN_06323 [Oesophagostomum dentatum]
MSNIEHLNFSYVYETFFMGSFVNSTSTITAYLGYLYAGIFFAILVFSISMVILWRQADKWKKYTDHICSGSSFTSTYPQKRKDIYEIYQI